MTAENAFAAAHSQRLLFETDAWRDARARLDAGLGTREPFLLVTGEAGTGKTALVLEAAAAWGERATVAFVTNPALTRMEFLEEIARRFGADPPSNPSKPQLLACLEQTLAKVAAGKVAVLVVEEAHELDSELLDELRLIVNSAAQAKRPFEAVLVGLPALDAKLEQAQASLRQRVAVHCRLNPLSRKETRKYLHHRVAASESGDGPAWFPRQTCNEIFDRTYGVPRAINSLAAEAIRVATAENQKSVTAEHVQVAATRINLDVPARVASARAAEAAESAASPDSAPGSKSAESAGGSTAAGAPAGSAAVATPKTTSAAPQPAPAAASAAAGKGNATPKSPAQTSGTTKSAPAPPAPKAASAKSPPTPETATPKTGATPAGVATAQPSTGQAQDTVAEGDEALAVTTALSVDMDPDDPRAKDWISRFVGNQGPPRIGSALGDPFPPEAYADVEVEVAPEPMGSGKRSSKARPRKLIRVVEDEFPSAAGAAFESPVGVRPTGIPRPSHDHRGGGRMGGPMFALGVVVVVAVGWIVLLKGGELSLPSDTSSGSAHVGAADSADANSSGDDESTAKRSGSSTMRSAATPDDRVSTLDSEPPDSSTMAPEDGPPKRMVIEVGTYIDAERARFERDQLIAETGLRVWVTRVTEYGSESYRVIVGTFPTEERAEASASYMLERGLVSEARVVELHAKKGRR